MNSDPFSDTSSWISAIQKRHAELKQKYAVTKDTPTAHHLAKEMRLLEAALLGITQYGAKRGICVSCQLPIPDSRLEIICWTLWCTACSGEQDLKTEALEELLFPLTLAKNHLPAFLFHV